MYTPKLLPGPANDGCDGVYAIVNVATGEFYIGSAYNMWQRWIQHRSQLKCGTHCNERLQAAYEHNGAGTFRCVVVTYLPVHADLCAHEQYYVDLLAPQYNMKTRFHAYDPSVMPPVDVEALRRRIIYGPHEAPRWTRKTPLPPRRVRIRPGTMIDVPVDLLSRIEASGQTTLTDYIAAAIAERLERE